MKRLLLTATMFVFMVVSNAQNADSVLVLEPATEPKEDSVKQMYFEIGGGPSSSDGGFFQAAITFSLKKNWMGSISFYHFKLRPDNLPDDYKPAQEPGWMIIGKKVDWPKRNIGTLNFTAGKEFNFGNRCWATTQAGLSFGGSEKISYKSQTVNGSGLSNYTIRKESIGLIGGLLKADLNFALASWVGLGLGCIYSFNSVQSAIGSEFKLLIGKMKP